MFVPTFEAILKTIGVTQEQYSKSEKVVLSKSVFEMLVAVLSLAQNFDESWYVSTNPDVASAVEEGTTSAYAHFIRYGYFEGRQPSPSIVDEQWYLDRYADVADAVAGGEVASGIDHYAHTGALEWRAPNPAVQDLVAAWRDLAGQATDGGPEPQR